VPVVYSILDDLGSISLKRIFKKLFSGKKDISEPVIN
jgi:hypothetical protein